MTKPATGVFDPVVAQIHAHRVTIVWLVVALSLLLPMNGYAASGAQEAVHNIRMQAHQSYFREQCLELAAHQSLRYSLHSQSPIDFNVHHHGKTETVYPDRVAGVTEHRNSIAISDGGEYCFMFTNVKNLLQPFTVELRYDISSQ